jgi:hypothetical protein
MQTRQTHPDEMHTARPPVIGSPVRYAATLVISLIASAPAFGSVMNGRLSLPEALLRFLIAFAVLWALGALLTLVSRVPGSAGTDR